LNLPKRPLSAEIRHGLFLAFKEALNNVVKHAGATEVRISLSADESGFELTVQDNGRGFTAAAVAAQTAGADAARSTPGNGLPNMQSRLQEIGGSADIFSEPGAGTRITFRVTLRPHHEQP
jgi:signal transduction histidine kinase